MRKRDEHRRVLASLEEWEPCLLSNSGLPGPRANLELVAAVADLASRDKIERWLESDDEFLALCGTASIGRLLAEGDRPVLPRLRTLASDRRWRIREGVAMALQRWGDVDVVALARELDSWASGSRYEQRAAVAGLCEPRLMKRRDATELALELLDHVTASVEVANDRHSDGFKVLRQALGYCWSVAVAALPESGLERFRRWERSSDADISRIVRENLAKSRLQRLLPAVR